MRVTDLVGAVKPFAPHLSLSTIIAMGKAICELGCPIIDSMRSYRTFAPRLTTTALMPHQVARAYNFPKVDPKLLANRKVFIIEFGGAYDPVDIKTYCEQSDYAMPKLSNLYADGAKEVSDPQGADGEVCLDICVIAGAAPGCEIIVVFAPNSEQGFVDGVTLALDSALKGDAISISWGGPEDGWSTAGMFALDAVFKRAVESGIGVYCASGDNGSGDGELGNHVDYPASSPYVIACGGTRLTLNADGTRQSETAWSPGFLGKGGASGGGISAVYTATPWWQDGVDTHDQAGRRVPDISGNADPSTGYLVSIGGQLQQVGGTSAVAPLMAAHQLLVNAEMGAHVGKLPQRFYQAPKCFYDVTQGNNGGFHSGTGYDCVTGLGAIDAEAFLESLKS